MEMACCFHTDLTWHPNVCCHTLYLQSPNCQITDPRSIAANGRNSFGGGLHTARKNAQPMVRGRLKVKTRAQSRCQNSPEVLHDSPRLLAESYLTVVGPVSALSGPCSDMFPMARMLLNYHPRANVRKRCCTLLGLCPEGPNVRGKEAPGVVEHFGRPWDVVSPATQAHGSQVCASCRACVATWLRSGDAGKSIPEHVFDRVRRYSGGPICDCPGNCQVSWAAGIFRSHTHTKFQGGAEGRCSKHAVLSPTNPQRGQ